MTDIQNLPEVVMAMERNEPLPDRDVVLNENQGQFLACYLKLSDALARLFAGPSLPADLLPGVPATHRYTILDAQLTEERNAGASAPAVPALTASLKASGMHDIRRAVIAGVAKDALAKDQVLPVFQNWKDPASLTKPADLPENIAIVSRCGGKLQLTGSAKLGFNFNWLREIAPGKLSGNLGLKIDAAHETSLQFSVSGDFTAVVARDAGDWLRLRVFKRHDSGFNFASAITVGAQPSTPLPNKVDDLLAAMLDVPGADAPSLDRAFESLAAFSSLDPATRRTIGVLLGPVKSQSDFDKAKAAFGSLTALRDSIYQKAFSALEKKYQVELSYRYASTTSDTALLDCSFDSSVQGMQAYRQALQGEFLFENREHEKKFGDTPGSLDSCSASNQDRRVPDHVRIHQGLLTHGIREQGTLELHLPFLNRKQWSSRLEALAQVRVGGVEEGRLLAYTGDASQQVIVKNTYQSVLALSGALTLANNGSSTGFTLAYTDQRKLRSAQLLSTLMPVLQAYGFDGSAGQWLAALQASAPAEVETSFTLSIPGQLAEAWMDAPLERDDNFAQTYARVSVAVQRALRKWLPFVYFSDPGRYDTIGAAYPLLIYQFSRPFTGNGRTEFAYDVMDQESTAQARRIRKGAFKQDLARVQQLLLQAGKRDTAAFYTPRRAPNVLAAVTRDPRMMNCLLYSDAVFVEQLIELGIHARRFKDQVRTSPDCAVRDLADFAADLVKTFHGKLKRLYGGQEFLAFGSLLLIEATNALSASEKAPPVRAVLSITAGDIKQTFVNASYQA